MFCSGDADGMLVLAGLILTVFLAFLVWHNWQLWKQAVALKALRETALAKSSGRNQKTAGKKTVEKKKVTK